jgi:hypothetical protein
VVAAVNWTREDFEQDKTRYQQDLDALLALGLTDGHPLVERQRRRLETVNRVLTDPAYGLALGIDKEAPDGPADNPA